MSTVGWRRASSRGALARSSGRRNRVPGRRQRIAQVVAAVVATTLGAAAVFVLVGRFGSPVQVPAAVVIQPSRRVAPTVPPIPPPAEGQDSWATIVKSAPHVIEGGDGADDSAGDSATTGGDNGTPESTFGAGTTTSPTLVRVTTTTDKTPGDEGSDDGGNDGNRGRGGGTTTTTIPDDSPNADS